MKSAIRDEVKQKLVTSIRKYVSGFEYTNSQPLDLLIPKERKIRSVVGGLETSMGTTVWEPIARTLAQNNGFEVLGEKILRPNPFPNKLARELSTLISARERTSTWISIEECIKRLREICKDLDREGVEYVRPAAGTGVDIFFKKAGKEYAFDIKTVQPNVGSIKSFNKQILEWYAYRIFQNPDVKISCQIAYPYNPHSGDFWSYAPHTGGILEPGKDAVVGNEFWDFLSGEKDTFQQIVLILKELNKEGFGKELSTLIERIHTPSEG